MNIKKIGTWAGAFIGSFVVILIAVYFLFPYLNPDKAASVKNSSSQTNRESTFDPNRYSLQAVDSLNQAISTLQGRVDTLQDSVNFKQQIIDSLKLEMETGKGEPTTQPVAQKIVEDFPEIEEATKPLLSLDEDVLAPIVDLLEEQQLISLYRKGSGRQREKLLRSLKPEKAARILKKVM